MRYDDNRVFEIHQIIFQPAHRFDIEVVRRLVQKQHVGVSEQCLRQQNAHLLFCVQIRHQRIMQLFGNFQSVQKLPRLIFRVVSAQLGELSFQFARADAVLFRKIGIRVQSVLLVHNVHQFFKTEHYGPQYRFVIVFVLILL